jgi:hypothetical protein
MIRMTRLNATAILLLLLASATVAQTSSSTWTAANRSWPRFWRQFSVVINKKDHAALKNLMPADFFDGGGGLKPAEWLEFIDENEKNGSWRDLQRSMARGTVVSRQWSSKGVPTRVTKDKAYYFEFRKKRGWV